jgi:peptidoglycan/LPS O-acetylase OafA/YrhL
MLKRLQALFEVGHGDHRQIRAMEGLRGLAWAALGEGSHVRLVMFVAGILLFEALGAERPMQLDKVGLPALVAGLVAIDLLVAGPARFAVLFVSFFLVCHAAFRGQGLTARVFCWTPLRWLGNMSYSYYLIHGLALKAAFFVLAKLVPAVAAWDGAFWGLLPLLFGLTLVPSALLFAAVERPYSLALKPRIALAEAGRAS